MRIPNSKKEQIALFIIKTLYSHWMSINDTHCVINTNTPFDKAFGTICTNEYKIKDIDRYLCKNAILNWLNTDEGQSFFVNIANILCDGEKKDFKGKLIFTNQINAISEIMIDLKNGTQEPSLSRENQIINNNRSGNKQTAQNFTADCFYETDTEVVAIELKSVRPNSGEMKGEKQKILQAKAVLQELYPNKIIKYYFGFPFDPTSTSDTEYDKSRFIDYLVEAEKFIDKDEILIADGLWSFLLGKESGVMAELLNIINTIATPSFMDKYNSIQNKDTGYDSILTEWFLDSEHTIFENRNRFTEKSYIRIKNQNIFNTDGSYNNKRLELLNVINQNR